MKEKKSIMNQIVSVFILLLVVSILAGVSFLFISGLKGSIISSTTLTSGQTNVTGAFINQSGYALVNYSELGFSSPVIVAAYNQTSGNVIGSGNYSVSSAGILTNATATNWGSVKVNYTFNYIADADAKPYLAANTTESAGFTITSYLGLIFLALIFGALLTLVLKVILPYVNLGQGLGGF